ncbi:hypothetical protein JTE90_004652 [Oedothorax gibbosus]|uniref:Cilia- and flagella-associated protein 91 n=1 Tax=Oedothorax gibbosus TaxID=931172 RepID=A0AAV6UWL6_9ARAC|nr:hypothetical protein JTE90_004652 [Oedothorax gibbosus]
MYNDFLITKTDFKYSDRKTSKHYSVSGANFCKYYQRPTKTSYAADGMSNTEAKGFNECHTNKNYNAPFQDKSTQTVYRESQSQTDPWDPPFTIIKKFKDPDILDLRNFCYGNGLPAGPLEVEQILNTKKLKALDCKSTSDTDDRQFKNKKQVIQNQVKSNWDNRIAVLNQAQQEKLALMRSNTVDDLKRYHMKKECILKSLWNNKKVELCKTHVQLEQKLQKELHVLDRNFSSYLNDHLTKNTSSKPKKHPEMTKGIDYVLNNHYLSNTFGASIVKKWLEEDSVSLTCDILPKTRSKIKNDALTEPEFHKFFEKKKAKHPPQIENEYPEEENHPEPTLKKPEVVLEPLVIEKKEVNLVTVLQQVLRGLACQKQMLDLIERHQDGLTTVLEPLYPGIADS